MFEKAVRLKIRWPFRGQCSVEDLWDLPAEYLDAIYKGLSRQAKAQAEESLLDTKSEANEVLDLQIAIVKHIVTVKLAEAEARKNATLNAARKQHLLSLVADKQDDALRELSVEDLQKLIAETE